MSDLVVGGGFAAYVAAVYVLKRWLVRRAVVRGFRARRAALDLPWSLRRATAEDPLATRLARSVGPVTAALVAHGYVELGDAILLSDGRPLGAMRALVDPSGTRFALLVVGREAPRTFQLMIRSYAADGSAIATTIGARSDAGRLASPPGMRSTVVADSLRAAQVDAAHVPPVPLAALARATTLEGLLELETARHAALVAWRRAQPEADLYAADLDTFLGSKLQRLRGHLATQTSGVPRAVARIK